MKILQKIGLSLAIASLPVLAFAAYNDVSLQGAVISTGGATINISGSDSVVENIVVDGTSLTVQMQPSSQITMSVAEFNQLSYSTSVGGWDYFEYTCGTNQSTLRVTHPGSATTTVTITPSSTICGSGSGNSTAGSGAPFQIGGGGGGGGGYTYIPAPTVTTTNTTDTATLQAQLATLQGQLANLGAKGSLTLRLTLGFTGPEVKILQQILNTDPETQVALSGPGSPGNETTLFGGATLTALKKFQAKWGIVSSGTAASTGYGATGPMTRAKLNAI